MRRHILLLVVLVAASIACRRGESPTEPSTNPTTPLLATMTGRTLDPNGTAIGNVSLRLTSSATDAVFFTTVSGADAVFRFNGIPADTYVITFRPPGSTTDQGGGIVRLLAGSNAHDILVSSCRIPYGVVRDAATGAPIAGAKVTIFNHSTTTDANGRYSIDFGCAFVDGGTIVVSVEHPDYVTLLQTSRASAICTCSFDFLMTHR